MDAPFTVLPTLPPFRLRVVPTTLTFKKPAGTSRGVNSILIDITDKKNYKNLHMSKKICTFAAC